MANENEYGLNFQAEYDYVKGVDSSRPVMFSYPGKVPKDRGCFDIASMHYVSYEGNLEQYGLEIRDFGLPGIPVLHDEWAHVACYNTPTLATDLNVRNFWGESMKMMWDGCFASEGGIGGAIWGYIDEVFMLPDTVVGYGPWGILSFTIDFNLSDLVDDGKVRIGELAANVAANSAGARILDRALGSTPRVDFR